MTKEEFDKPWNSLQQMYPDDKRLLALGTKEEYWDNLRFYGRDLVVRAINKANARNQTRICPSIETIKSYLIVMCERQRDEYKEPTDNERLASPETIRKCIEEFERKHFKREVEQDEQDVPF